MKKSELLKLIKEELQGYSPQIGKTKGLTPDTLNKILKKIADDTEDEVSEVDNPVDRITLDIPLFIRLLEYAKEDAQTDMDLHDVAEKAIQLGSVQNTALSMDDYDSLIPTGEVSEVKGLGRRGLNEFSIKLADEILDFFKKYAILRKEPYQRKYKSGLSDEEFVARSKEGFLNMIVQIVRDKVMSDKTITKEGLWANINAKRKRGEKPAHKNSNAHKDAVASGNAMKK